MTTTHASTAAPKPVESAAKPAQASARAAADKPADADLFSNLLNLVSDTHQAQAPVVLTAETLPAAETDTGTDDDALLNPLAALLAWATPAAAAATPTASAQEPAGATRATPATDTKALPADGALPATGVDIEGMARVDEALPAPAAQAANAARAALASRPAFSAPPAHAAASHRTTEGVAPASTPAMVWQRGAVSSTEFLQHQHTTQLAQVRSTVALNERFGLPGAIEPSAPALREFTTTAAAGGPSALAAAPDAGTAVAGAPGADTTGGGEHAPDAHTDSQPGDAQGRADAGQEAEGPTVSHWGTQHLRHASLRVGGEGGADAIDIQLAVKGQEVQIAFQTDNAEARASLRESAGGSLAELLQRSGIQLGSVSVGAHGQPQGGGSNARPTSPRTEALGRSAAVADAPRPVAQPRADGSRPLDVFA